MRGLIVTVLMALIFPMSGSVYSCINSIDQYSSGVLFNSNEGYYPERFDELGTNRVNFIKDCKMIDIGPGVKNVELLTPTKDPVNWMDQVSINNIRIDNGFLSISVEYGGGCEPHQFVLYADSIIESSDPGSVKLTLLHNANNDMCKSIRTETLVFDLTPIKSFHTSTAPVKVEVKNSNIISSLLWYPNDKCVIRYRAHNDSHSMVYLDFYATNYQKFPYLRMVRDSTVEIQGKYDFASTIFGELQWLLHENIITGVSETKLEKIRESLTKSQGQFWTFQDTLLNYGSYFTYRKDSTGSWAWDKTTISVQKNDGCGAEFKFTLPPDNLGGSVSSNVNNVNNRRNNAFLIKKQGGSYIITLNNQTEKNGYLEVLDLRGRVLSKLSIPQNQSSLNFQVLPVISRGIYQVVYYTEGRRICSKLINFCSE